MSLSLHPWGQRSWDKTLDKPALGDIRKTDCVNSHNEKEFLYQYCEIQVPGSGVLVLGLCIMANILKICFFIKNISLLTPGN